ncbi:DNA-binding protein [Rhizobium sp. TRM95111]|uniref:DNA-binding protein n=1 Tax=Rhizobium alarense TaxID=2846851 RepID=UPI001F3C9911|nr:DNA-binding protein [Rhizobium alarense]MCF3643001.1 DNA-binding protein [Rhizobium alarense]
MAGSTLREASLPRFALRRGEAAAALGISPGLFDIWVKDGLMPKGKKVRGVVLWDTEGLRARWQAIADEDAMAEEDGENPFDATVV